MQRSSHAPWLPVLLALLALPAVPEESQTDFIEEAIEDSASNSPEEVARILDRLQKEIACVEGGSPEAAENPGDRVARARLLAFALSAPLPERRRKALAALSEIEGSQAGAEAQAQALFVRAIWGAPLRAEGGGETRRYRLGDHEVQIDAEGLALLEKLLDRHPGTTWARWAAVHLACGRIAFRKPLGREREHVEREWPGLLERLNRAGRLTRPDSTEDRFLPPGAKRFPRLLGRDAAARCRWVRFGLARPEEEAESTAAAGLPDFFFPVVRRSQGEVDVPAASADGPEIPGPGIYFLCEETPDSYAEQYVVATDLALVAIHDGPDLEVVAVDRMTGRLVPNVSVEFLLYGEDGTGLRHLCAAEAPEGRARLSASEVGGTGGSVSVLARAGEDLAWVEWIWWDPATPPGPAISLTALVLPASPLYRPGDRVDLALVARRNPLDEAAGSERFRIEVADPTGAVVHGALVETDPFGVAATSLELSPEARLGSYEVRAVQEVSAEQENGRARPPETAGARFRVEEYRRPEREALLSLGTPNPRPGERVEVQVEARLLSGPGLAGVEGSYEIRCRPHEIRDPFSPWYAWASWFYSRRAWGGDEYGSDKVLWEGDFVTGEEGRTSIPIDLPAALGDQEYTVTVRMPWVLSGELVERLSFLATLDEESLFARSRVDLLLAPRPVTVEFAATDRAGTRVEREGVAVLERREVGPAGPWVEVERVPFRTARDRSSTVAVEPKGAGAYRVRARLSGGAGAQASFRVLGGEPFPLAHPPRLFLSLDRPAYAVGDKLAARIVVPEARGTVHLWLLGDRVRERWVLDASRGSMDVSFDLTEADRPNLVLVGVFVSDDFVVRESLEIPVLADRELKVEIETDRARYSPGERARIAVRVADRLGRPVAARVLLGVVDEAVYLVQEDRTPALAAAFPVSKKPIDHETWASPCLAEKMAAHQGGGGEGGIGACFGDGGGDGSLGPVRRDFRAVVGWFPALDTRPDGTLEVELDLPETLTRWRIVARALGARFALGDGKADLRTWKPFAIRPFLPRNLTARDEIELVAEIDNESSEPRAARVELESASLEPLDARVKEITVPASGHARASWLVRVLEPDDPGGAQAEAVVLFRAQAHPGADSDAVEVRLPWRAHVGIEALDVPSWAQEEPARSVPFPASDRPSRVTVTVSAELPALVAEALPYLVDYPYGCAEQTMSRFVPLLFARRAQRALGREDPDLDEKITSCTRASILRLLDFHHPDGGWGWWKQDSSDDRMTAYVAWGLALARENGEDVPPASLEEAKKFLQVAWNERSASSSAVTRAEIALALAVLQDDGISGPDLLNEAGSDALALARVALVLARTGRTADAREALGRLGALGVTAGGALSFPPSDGDRWATGSILPTAAALEAYLALSPEDARVVQIVRWLAGARTGLHWKNTRATAAAVSALASYLEARGAGPGGGSYRVRWRERIVGEGRLLDLAGKGQSIAIDLSAGEASNLDVLLDGAGPLFVSIARTALTDAEEPGASSRDLVLERSFHRVKDGSGTSVQEPVAAGDAVEEGDEVEVRLRMQAPGGGSFFVLVDPFPSGFEPVSSRWRDSPWSGSSAHVEYRAASTVFYFSEIRGDHEVASYRLRAIHRGRFHALPARLEAMYEPARFACSNELRLSIVPRLQARATPVQADPIAVWKEGFARAQDPEEEAWMVRGIESWPWSEARDYLAKGIAEDFPLAIQRPEVARGRAKVLASRIDPGDPADAAALLSAARELPRPGEALEALDSRGAARLLEILPRLEEGTRREALRALASVEQRYSYSPFLEGSVLDRWCESYDALPSNLDRVLLLEALARLFQGEPSEERRWRMFEPVERLAATAVGWYIGCENRDVRRRLLDLFETLLAASGGGLSQDTAEAWVGALSGSDGDLDPRVRILRELRAPKAIELLRALHVSERNRRGNSPALPALAAREGLSGLSEVWGGIRHDPELRTTFLAGLVGREDEGACEFLLAIEGDLNGSEEPYLGALCAFPGARATAALGRFHLRSIGFEFEAPLVQELARRDFAVDGTLLRDRLGSATGELWNSYVSAFKVAWRKGNREEMARWLSDVLCRLLDQEKRWEIVGVLARFPDGSDKVSLPQADHQSDDYSLVLEAARRMGPSADELLAAYRRGASEAKRVAILVALSRFQVPGLASWLRFEYRGAGERVRLAILACVGEVGGKDDFGWLWSHRTESVPEDLAARSAALALAERLSVADLVEIHGAIPDAALADEIVRRGRGGSASVARAYLDLAEKGRWQADGLLEILARIGLSPKAEAVLRDGGFWEGRGRGQSYFCAGGPISSGVDPVRAFHPSESDRRTRWQALARLGRLAEIHREIRAGGDHGRWAARILFLESGLLEQGPAVDEEVLRGSFDVKEIEIGE